MRERVREPEGGIDVGAGELTDDMKCCQRGGLSHVVARKRSRHRRSEAFLLLMTGV